MGPVSLILIPPYRLDEEVADGLPVMPLADAAGDLFQEGLMVLQDLWDLVEHLVHQQGVHDAAAVRLLQGPHVALREEGPDILDIER